MPRRDYSKVAFAATGDKNVIPTPVQPSGAISLQTGWTFDYQRDNGAGGGTPDPLAKNIDRQDMNGILNEVTASLGEIQQNGLPIWVSTAAPYPLGAIVRQATDNKNYKSTATNNSTVPGAVGATWEVDDIGEALTLSGPFRGVVIFRAVAGAQSWVVPAGVTKAYVKVIGGGGGGAVRTTNPGPSGGGGGGIAEGMVSGLTPGSPITITVGEGGNGGGADNTNGAAGGASSFGTVMTATGGDGGNFIGNATNAGAGSGGQINTNMGKGAVPVGRWAAAAGSVGYGGAGAGFYSPYASGDTETPLTPGAGGGGRLTSSGAAGARGAVFVYW